MKNFLNFIIVVFFVGLIQFGCQAKKDIMTPTKLINIVLKSVFTKDSSLFIDRFYNKDRIVKTLALATISDFAFNKEMELANDTNRYRIYHDSLMLQYRLLIHQFDSIGLKPFLMDTVDFENYFNAARPYFRLEADAWFNHGKDTFVLKIKDAILLVDGWNLGSVKLYKASEDPMFVRIKDKLIEEAKNKKRILNQDSSHVN